MSEAIQFTKYHEALLEKHSEKFEQHGAILEGHSATLDKHTRILEEHRAEFKKLNAKVEKLEADAHRRGLLQEEMRSDLTAVLEIVTHINRRFTQQDEMSHSIENHEHRITALELHAKSDRP